MATALGGVLDFFRQLGVYDVLLPFILTFTIMFAILERTALFGLENKVTKKNLNAMVSFVVAFLVVASSKLVEVITKVSSEIIVLLLIIVFFLMMIGTFYTNKEIADKGVNLEGAWRTGMTVFIAIAIAFIFLDALKNDRGQTWLEVFWNWLSQFATNTGVAAIVLIIVLIIIIVVVTRGD